MTGAMLRASILVLLATLFPAIVGAQDATDDEARANFEAGRIAYADARYGDALPYFMRAYELSPRPKLLYHIGVCHDRLGHDEEALDAFEQYLAGVVEHWLGVPASDVFPTATELLSPFA